MAKFNRVGIVFATEGEKKFKETITSINKSISATKAEMKLVTAEYEGNANSLEALRKKQEILNRLLEEQKQKTAGVENALEGTRKKYSSIGKDVNVLSTEFKKQNKQLEELRIEYDTAQKRLNKMTTEGNSSEKAMQKQRGTIDSLKNAIKKQESAIDETNGKLAATKEEYRKCGNLINDWQTRLNRANAEVVTTQKNLNRYTEYMNEAEKATDQCATSIDKFGKQVGEKNWKPKMQDFATGGVINAISEKALETVLNGAEAVKDAMIDTSKASAQLSASTGLSESVAKRYEAVMRKIKGGNFGEDYQDVASAMAEVIQIMGELDDSSMQGITESAITLRDTFGMDVNESIRAADVMMKTMGVDAGTAFDLITTGAQNGLNRSGELVDNLTEYASLWGQAGFSASEMFSILENGLDAGAYNLDKVNDFVKEFGVSLSDGRIEENIGSFSEKSQELFMSWKNGEASTSDVFYSIIGDLENMTNKQDALTTASNIWSALGEDNAMQVLTALNDVNDGYTRVNGAMDQLKETKFSDLESAMGNLGSKAQEYIVTPIADKAIPLVTGLANTAADVLEGIFDPPKTQLQEFIEEIETSNEEVKTSIQNAQDIMSGGEKEAASLEAYKQTLIDLNSVTEKTEFQKFQLKSVIQELSGSVPELAAAFDEETGSLNLTNEEIVKLMDNQKKLVMQKAILDAQQESLEAVAQATLNKARADSAAEQAAREFAEVNKRYQKEIEETGTDMNSLYGEYLDAEIAMDNAAKTQNEMNETLKTAQTQADAETKALEELKKTYGLTEEETKKTTSSTEELGNTAEDTAAKVSSSAETQKNALEAVRQKYEEFRTQLENDIQNKIRLFDGFDGGEDITVEEMLKNLQAQREGLEKWKENMDTLAQEVGNTITPEFYNAILEMGPEAANAVQHMVATLDQDNGRELLTEMAKEWGMSMDFSDAASEALANTKTAIEAGFRGLGSSDTDFSTLEDAIENAKSSLTDGWSGLSDPMKEQLDEAVQTARSIGIQIPEGLAEGIASGEISPKDAISQLNGGIQGMFDGLAEVARQQGITIPDELSAGIASGGQAAVDAYNTLIALLNGQAAQARTAGEEVGSEAAGGTKASIEAGTPGVEQASSSMASAGAGKAGEKKSEFGTAGTEAASMYAKAIMTGGSSAAAAAANMASRALAGARQYNGSFQSAGYFMAAGVAEGIRSGASGAIGAATAMATQALASAKAALRIQSPSKRFRDEVGHQIAAGMAFGIKDKASLAGKAASKMSAKVYTNATAWLKKYKKSHQVSLEEEKYYWQQVQEHTKKGTNAYKNAQKQIEAINKKITAQKDTAQKEKDAIQRKQNVQSGLLEGYKTYYKMSPKAEAEYWNIARKQFKAGTDERIEADKEYLDALQEFYDQRKELDENYADDSKEINKKLQEDIEDLQDSYKDAVKSRKEDILSQMKLFEAWDSEGYDADTLLYNLKTQVSGLALWEQQLEELGKKNISGTLMDELKRMGPDAAASIYSLNQMTAAQLSEYQKLWEQKNALAESQAVKENEPLRAETNQQITQLKLDAQAELNALNMEYRAALAELNTGLSTDLHSMVNKAGSIGEEAVAGLIAGIGKAVNSVDTYNSTTKVVSQVSAQLSALQQEGNIIGKNTLDGLLEGMTDQTKINMASKNVIQSIKRAMEEEAEIHSPSRLFRRETGPQIPAGVAAGIEDGTKTAERSSENMVQRILTSAKEKMQRQQEELRVKAETLNDSGIVKLNRMTERHPIQEAPVVNVDNSNILMAMQQVMSGMSAMMDRIERMQVVMYPDAVIGELREGFDRANADITVMRNRGRL